MNDWLLHTGVKVVQSMRHPDANLKMDGPPEGRIMSVVEMITEVSVGHEVVHEDNLKVVVAVTNKRHKINVTELGKHLILSHELVSPLL